MIKLIIFDYDGVIVDSFRNVYIVYKKMCKNLGINFPENIEKFRKVYGYNSEEAYRNLGIDPFKKGIANKIFREEIVKKKGVLFKGIKQVLKELNKKYILVLLSASYVKEVKSKLYKFNISKYFSEIISNTDISSTNLNKVKAIKDLINKYNLDIDEVVMIGDRDIDYDQGKRAGLKHIILVEYGWGYHKKIKQKIYVKKPSDIIKAVEVLNK